MTSKKTSDAGIFLWMVYQTMQKMNLDAAAIFARVHLPDQPPDKFVRRDNATQRRFWQAAQQISQDSDIGLHVGHHIPPFRGQVVEYLFLSSPTFGEGLKRTIRYQALLTDAMSFQLDIINETTAMISGLNHPVRHYLECAIGILLNFLKYISDGTFIALEIGLPYLNGADQEEYQKIWGCPVKLDKSNGYICFNATQLNTPSPAYEAELLKVHEHHAASQLELLNKHQLIYEIEKILASGLLESGEFDQNSVAQHLNRSARSLRADLQLLNTSYEKVIAHYRERLARRLLSQTQESIDQIVYLTGFSEPSAFSRAFKRWTGETPTAYRQRKQI
ncbi:AraC family transcriptional regulator [Acinetobacter proteolyticus]|uniref:AraC family transcriptional regulator n=1 Tax=Acinetobacter proteolyticus TaxID=1776741 RepID=A0A2N0WG03_9GAMM|nr:AraC family transcriptional regulator [Acinetobacter proteolyticus]PKF34005.1 AraC family transcriptional regulator [Acinetobacter proteolyticus]